MGRTPSCTPILGRSTLHWHAWHSKSCRAHWHSRSHRTCNVWIKTEIMAWVQNGSNFTTVTCLDDLWANNGDLNISRQIHIGDKILTSTEANFKSWLHVGLSLRVLPTIQIYKFYALCNPAQADQLGCTVYRYPPLLTWHPGSTECPAWNDPRQPLWMQFLTNQPMVRDAMLVSQCPPHYFARVLQKAYCM